MMAKKKKINRKFCHYDKYEKQKKTKTKTKKQKQKQKNKQIIKTVQETNK